MFLPWGLKWGGAPAMGEFVHIGLRQPRKFARFGEVQDHLLPPEQPLDAVEPLLDSCVFTHNHSVLAFDKRRCATLVM